MMVRRERGRGVSLTLLTEGMPAVGRYIYVIVPGLVFKIQGANRAPGFQTQCAKRIPGLIFKTQGANRVHGLVFNTEGANRVRVL